MTARRWKAVAAMAANRVIGRNGALPWHLPEDLKFFRKLTTGHTIVMGRKTWESLGKPLPNRRNIVLSRTLPAVPGMEVVRSLEALRALEISSDVFVIGGEEIYRLLLHDCAEIFLTVLEESPEGDAWMPEFEENFPHMEVLAVGSGCEWRRYCRESTGTAPARGGDAAE